MSVFVSAFSFDAEDFAPAVEDAASVAGQPDPARIRRLEEHGLARRGAVLVTHLADSGGDHGDRQWCRAPLPARSGAGADAERQADRWSLAMAPSVNGALSWAGRCHCSETLKMSNSPPTRAAGEQACRQDVRSDQPCRRPLAYKRSIGLGARDGGLPASSTLNLIDA